MAIQTKHKQTGGLESASSNTILETDGLISIKKELDNYLRQLSRSSDDKNIDTVITLFKDKILSHEKTLWDDAPSKESIEQYQDSFRALEHLYDLKATDDRYNFRIIIPVADRPQQLKQCLDSLMALCQSYGYGGFKNNTFSKISVLIADDSSDEKSRVKHREYCEFFTQAGLTTEYFGTEDQLAQLERSNPANNMQSFLPGAQNINEDTGFSHKGASIMRNITYLKLNQDRNRDRHLDNTLFYFIDSDQEFSIVTDTDTGKSVHAINYFHYLNEIFKQQDVSILTGKVVGDPPVSPSVMAGNFQQDTLDFLSILSMLEPDRSCQFHQQKKASTDDAAYHDMAELFGFDNRDRSFDFHCPLTQEHTNADCLENFSNKLEHFFYGEHPTRKTYFNYGDGFSKTIPARTVYTGNYIIKPDMLRYFIPFATMKLRMAGPVLGRLLQSKLQKKFVSANLPMLHNRTIRETGQSEFRAGVRKHYRNIDLSDEFIRQFYGDVLLFTINKLTQTGFPESDIDTKKIRSILTETYIDINKNYTEKQELITDLRSRINDYFLLEDNWWNLCSGNTGSAVDNFKNFLDNIEKNFGIHTHAYREITSPEKTRKKLDEMFDALKSYQDDLHTWDRALNF
ncbi:MAG TPA: glycosyltransferase family 2 protein [Gammaproteobacteria bacterium]|nr:glycosyltransferase family 2 protein [Gammaproteobacteria bacterium]